MRGIGTILVVLIVAHLSSRQSAGAQEFPDERQRMVDRYLPWVATSLAVAASSTSTIGRIRGPDRGLSCWRMALCETGSASGAHSPRGAELSVCGVRSFGRAARGAGSIGIAAPGAGRR